nr:sigma-70 family RNA polymerase sigma factor [Cellulomonas composti]
MSAGPHGEQLRPAINRSAARTGLLVHAGRRRADRRGARLVAHTRRGRPRRRPCDAARPGAVPDRAGHLSRPYRRPGPGPGDAAAAADPAGVRPRPSSAGVRPDRDGAALPGRLYLDGRAEEPPPTELPADLASQVDEVAGLDSLHAAVAMLRHLPPRARAVLALRYLEDMSDREIAETLGISRSTVRVTAHQALGRLHTWAQPPSNREEVR